MTGRHRRPRGAFTAGLLALLVALCALTAGAQPRPARPGLRRYSGHGVRFDHPASWVVREQLDDDEVRLRVSRHPGSVSHARVTFARHRAAPNGGLRLADVVEAFRREQRLKRGPMKFAETPIIRKLLGGPTPGRQLRYGAGGQSFVAELYVAHHGRRAFALTFVTLAGAPRAGAGDAREAAQAFAAIADSFQADTALPARYPPVRRAGRLAYVGHGVAFQYPVGWTISESEDDASVTITVDEGPSTSPFIRLLLLRADSASRLQDAVNAYRTEVQARTGTARFELRRTARALNGERVDGASVSYSVRGAAQLTEVFLVQAGRRTAVVLLHASAAERALGSPAFELFARTFLLGAWPQHR